MLSYKTSIGRKEKHAAIQCLPSALDHADDEVDAMARGDLAKRGRLRALLSDGGFEIAAEFVAAGIGADPTRAPKLDPFG